MARNGSGTYARAVSAYVYGTIISQTDVNTEMNDIATALTASLAKDGQTVPTANIQLGGFKLVGVGNATQTTDALTTASITAATSKGTPVDADTMGLIDSAASNVLKKVTWANIKTTLAAYWVTVANIWTAAQTVTVASSTPLTVNSTQAAVNARIRLDTDKADSSVAYTLSNSQAGVNKQTSAVMGAGGGLQIYAAQSAGAQSTSGTLAVNINGSGVVTFPAGGVATALKSATTSVDVSAAAAPAAGQVLKATSSTTATWQNAGGITLGTPVASTSGTSIDFTGIPATAKRIEINFSGVSTSGTSNPLFQIGDAGGIENTGYLGAGSDNSTGANYTTGFGIPSAQAANVLHGTLILTLMNAATNTWAAFGIFAQSNIGTVNQVAGSKALSATLDRVRITTVGGADTFDAGLINITSE